MTTFYLIRHGRMAGDPHARFVPPVEGCLSPDGEQQAAALGEALSGVVFDGVFASPLGRAIQTAQTLRRAEGVPLAVLDWLEEWKPAHVLGDAPDTRFESLAAEAAALPPEQTWKTPAGEGALDMAARIVPGWIRLLASLGIRAVHGGYVPDRPEEDRTYALVAHGGSLGHLLSFVIGVPIRPNPPIRFAETGVARVSLNRQGDVWYPALEIAPP